MERPIKPERQESYYMTYLDWHKPDLTVEEIRLKLETFNNDSIVIVDPDGTWKIGSWRSKEELDKVFEEDMAVYNNQMISYNSFLQLKEEYNDDMRLYRKERKALLDRALRGLRD